MFAENPKVKQSVFQNLRSSKPKAKYIVVKDNGSAQTRDRRGKLVRSEYKSFSEACKQASKPGRNGTLAYFDGRHARVYFVAMDMSQRADIDYVE